MEIMSYDQMLKSGGYNQTGDQIVDDLRKALETTSGVAQANGNGPLMLENLDGVMTEVLITEQFFKLYNLLPKVPSANPYYQYNVHTGFGSSRAGGAGFAQGGSPQGGTSNFQRDGIYTKFLGVQRGITHQMLVTGQNGGAFEDPVVRENRDGTIELLEKVERELVFGQQAILDANGNNVNFDGMLTQMQSLYPQNVIDMQGLPLAFDNLASTAQTLVTGGKIPTINGYINLMSPIVSDGLNKQFTAANMVRFMKDQSVAPNYSLGQTLNGYDTQFGRYNFDFSILLQETDTNQPVALANANTPATPAITTQPAAAVNAAATFELGTFYYSVAAFNDYGESLPVVTNAIAVAAVGTQVTTVITRTTAATGYRVYRGFLADGSDAQWIAKIAQPTSGNATFVDTNAWRTQTADGVQENGIAIIMKPEARDLCIAQMTPMIKMPLPQVGTTFPFLLLLYMVSVIKAPQRVVIYKNCGQYTGD